MYPGDPASSRPNREEAHVILVEGPESGHQRRHCFVHRAARQELERTTRALHRTVDLTLPPGAIVHRYPA